MPSLLPAVVLAGACLFTTAAVASPPDPLGSVMWDVVHEDLLNGEPVVFDDRVKVIAPPVVEDGRMVPVSVRAEGLADVTHILVVGDLNPIPRVVLFEPVKARPFIALRMKVNEGTVIRAAVKTADGLWHVGGTAVQAPGGGCAAPRLMVGGDADWQTHLGEVRARAWRTAEGFDRLRLMIRHPMDTGLVDNVPEFFLDRLEVRNHAGDVVARLRAWAAMSADPMLTLEVAPAGLTAPDTAYDITGADSEGNTLAAAIPAPRQTMPAAQENSP